MFMPWFCPPRQIVSTHSKSPAWGSRSAAPSWSWIWKDVKKCDMPQIHTGLLCQFLLVFIHIFTFRRYSKDHGSEAISESVGSTHVLQTLTRKPLLHVAQTRLIERKTLGEKCKNIGHVRILTKRMAKSEYAGLHRNIQHRNIDLLYLSISWFAIHLHVTLRNM